MAVAWVDGGCLRNNQRGGPREAYGSYKIVQEDGAVMALESRFPLESAKSSNEAEYLSLIRLLRDSNLIEGSLICTDSALLMGQLEEDWRVKAPNLKQLNQVAKSLMKDKRVKLIRVPRAEIEEKLGH